MAACERYASSYASSWNGFLPSPKFTHHIFPSACGQKLCSKLELPLPVFALGWPTKAMLQVKIAQTEGVLQVVNAPFCSRLQMSGNPQIDALLQGDIAPLPVSLRKVSSKLDGSFLPWVGPHKVCTRFEFHLWYYDVICKHIHTMHPDRVTNFSPNSVDTLGVLTVGEKQVCLDRCSARPCPANSLLFTVHSCLSTSSMCTSTAQGC